MDAILEQLESCSFKQNWINKKLLLLKQAVQLAESQSLVQKALGSIPHSCKYSIIFL